MLIVKIDTDGAAFRDEYDETVLDTWGIEVNRLLDEVKHKIADGYKEGHLTDINGNPCGEWEYKQEKQNETYKRTNH